MWCVSSALSLTEASLLVDKLRRHGFVLLKLPKETSETVLSLERQCQTTIFNAEESIKRKLTKIFRKSFLFKNYLSYSYLTGPGKETWRFRAVSAENLTEKIEIPHLQEVDQLLDLTYNYIRDAHLIVLDIIKVIQLGITRKFSTSSSLSSSSLSSSSSSSSSSSPSSSSSSSSSSPSSSSLSSSYLLNACEPIFHSALLPYGLSHVNLLRYFDPKKEVPVKPHTDQYLLTILPLNSLNPSLELWDFSAKSWINIECDARAQQIKPFTYAVIIPGECLARLTNDFFVPTVHRVVSPPIGGRFSCPYFFSGKKGFVMDPSLSMFSLSGSTVPTTESETPLNNPPPVEIADFLWECSTNPNQTEITIMDRWGESVSKWKL